MLTLTHLKKIMPHAKTPPTKGQTAAKTFKLLVTFLNSKANPGQ
jgi:hypothetical protein